MTSEANVLPRFLQLQKAVMSSLRLKDVLDASVNSFTEMAAGAKVALFLCDHDSMSFRLMAAKGYNDASLDQLRVVPFAAESLLKHVLQKRTAISAADAASAPDLSAAIMKREVSKGQIALPLTAANALVGAVLLEVNNAQVLSFVDFLREVADLVALSVSNAIVFGRAEYERERLSTLHKATCALNGSALEINQVLQVGADTALVLANTPCCAIVLHDADNDVFQLAAFKGLDGGSLTEFDMKPATSIAGAVMRSTKTEQFGDGGKKPYGMPRGNGGLPFASVVAVPLVHGDRAIGALEVFSTESRAFRREQIDLLEALAQQLSASLHIGLSHESSISQSVVDAHTGLTNRWQFDTALDKEVERSQRKNHQMSVLLIDIDHLAQINEHLGEERGDETIKHVAATIKKTVRDIDVPCRYGGEEFAVILPETSHSDALEVADRLRQQVRNTPASGIGLVTVSVGVATYPDNAADSKTLMHDLEEALNVAKFEGRDRVKAALTGKLAGHGQIAWTDLANQARMAVISDRQSRLNSRLTTTPEYATWLEKPSSLVGKKKSN
ncbi:MAG: diguanylate cyclase [Cyanobacteria bacterium REEB67]|nr:diguanylate cyclase [Cyanobacteria bacterium REEB67]